MSLGKKITLQRNFSEMLRGKALTGAESRTTLNKIDEGRANMFVQKTNSLAEAERDFTLMRSRLGYQSEFNKKMEFIKASLNLETPLQKETKIAAGQASVKQSVELRRAREAGEMARLQGDIDAKAQNLYDQANPQIVTYPGEPSTSAPIPPPPPPPLPPFDFKLKSGISLNVVKDERAPVCISQTEKAKIIAKKEAAREAQGMTNLFQEELAGKLKKTRGDLALTTDAETSAIETSFIEGEGSRPDNNGLFGRPAAPRPGKVSRGALRRKLIVAKYFRADNGYILSNIDPHLDPFFVQGDAQRTFTPTELYDKTQKFGSDTYLLRKDITDDIENATSQMRENYK